MDPELQKLEDLYSAGFIFEEEYLRRRTEICQQLGLPEPAQGTSGATSTQNNVDDSSWRSTNIDTSNYNSSDTYGSTNAYDPYGATTGNADTISYDIQQQPFSNPYDAPIDATNTYPGSISTDEFMSRSLDALALSDSGVIGADSMTDPSSIMGSSGDDHVRYAFNNTNSHLNDIRVSAPSTPVKSTPKESRNPDDKDDKNRDPSFMDCSHIFTDPIREQSYDEAYNFTIPPSGGVIVIHRAAQAYIRTPLLPARSMTLSEIGAIFGMSLCELFKTDGSLAYTPLNRQSAESSAPDGHHVHVTPPAERIDSGVYYIRPVISHLHFAKRRIEIVESGKLPVTDFLDHKFGSHCTLPAETYVQWCHQLLEPGFKYDWMTPSDPYSSIRAQNAAKRWYQNHPAQGRRAWLHFLLRLRVVQHNAQVKSVKKASLSTDNGGTLVQELEQHIAEHRCIITGEANAVSGSFLCEQYHDDELINMFNQGKKYSEDEPEDRHGGEVVLSENWDNPPSSAEFEYDPEKEVRRSLAEVRAEYDEKPKFCYIDFSNGASMPAFRNHQIATFTQNGLAALFSK